MYRLILCILPVILLLTACGRKNDPHLPKNSAQDYISEQEQEEDNIRPVTTQELETIGQLYDGGSQSTVISLRNQMRNITPYPTYREGNSKNGYTSF